MLYPHSTPFCRAWQKQFVNKIKDWQLLSGIYLLSKIIQITTSSALFCFSVPFQIFRACSIVQSILSVFQKADH